MVTSKEIFIKKLQENLVKIEVLFQHVFHVSKGYTMDGGVYVSEEVIVEGDGLIM